MKPLAIFLLAAGIMIADWFIPDPLPVIDELVTLALTLMAGWNLVKS